MADHILGIKPEEMDAAESVMRAQLANFEELVDSIKTQVHTNLSECSGELYQTLKNSYDSEIQTMMNNTRDSIEIYIRKMREAADELGNTTNEVNNILNG